MNGTTAAAGTTGTNEIRSAFLGYFEARGHEVVPSSPLVPVNDPTLMFTNAGMVQFKNVFTGQEGRANSRAVSSQKCVRAGGKHNDLDNVGYTARHHTFFEMLGNFSFGDYFKEKAVFYAWDLLTGTFCIDPDRIWVTVYHDDDEAFDLWRKIAGLPETRVIRIATSDNFWAMGPTGPCGPCSEIFYDHGEALSGGPPGSADEEGDRFVEIWNLVFMQFDQISDDERVSLPAPSIDTGMGLERIAAVLQGTHDNYETDTFRRLIQASEDAAGVKAEGEFKASHRVIADHLRAASFLIADGVLPSNEGRGYVLRRIMRRAMRHLHKMGTTEPVMARLVPSLVGEMGQAYGELGRAEALITETLELEEESFQRTLGRGIKLLRQAVEELKGKEALPGKVAFKLYDTYGFPLDLTEDVMRAEGREVESKGFDKAMERQKAEARKNWAGSGDQATEKVWFEIRQAKGASEFLGYKTEAAEGEVLAIVRDGKTVKRLKAGEEAALILNQTPFYGESGGQIGDTGEISNRSGSLFMVSDTQKKLGDLVVHLGSLEEGQLSLGDFVELRVDGRRRRRLRANHSATHLMHEALRVRLGGHVTQKGSRVAPEGLRFDISHRKVISADELALVEADVNREIRRNTAVTTRLMTPAAAIEEGAAALFGEKYGDEARVVSMGSGAAGEKTSKARYSVELCGGTHVRRTGDIGLFKIVGQGSVSAGVRRLEALTGEAARLYLLEEEGRLRQAAGHLKSAPKDVPDRVKTLVEDIRRLEKELSLARRKSAVGDGGQAVVEIKEIGGVKFLGRVLEGIAPGDLRAMADEGKRTLGSGVVALVSVDDGKAALLVGVTDDLTSGIDAVSLVRAGAVALGGKGGGGRPDMAQAGGPDGAAAEKALEAIEALLAARG